MAGFTVDSRFPDGRRASRRVLSVLAALVLAFVLPLLAQRTALANVRVVAPTPPFTQCPAVGLDTSCRILIVINADGSMSIYQDSTQPPYEGDEDSLVGIQNNSSAPVSSIDLTGSDQSFPIGYFDGDGLCNNGITTPPAGCPFGPTGYEGPGTGFVVDPNNVNHVTVNFTGGLGAGKHTYFSLEGDINASTISTGGTNCAGWTNGYCIYATSSSTDRAGNQFTATAFAANNTGLKVGTPTSVKFTCTEMYTLNGQQHTRLASVTATGSGIWSGSRAGILAPSGTVDSTVTNAQAMMYTVKATDTSTGTSVTVFAPSAFFNNATQMVLRGGFGMTFTGNVTDTNVTAGTTTVVPNSSIACQAGYPGTGEAIYVP